MARSPFACVFLTLCLWGPGAQATELPPTGREARPAANLMSLSASASLEPLHDRVELVLAAQQEGPDAAALQRALAQVLGQALERARPETSPGQVELSTGPFQVQPRHDNEGRIRGWFGRAELVLAGQDLARLSALAGKLAGLQLTQVRWGLSPALRQATQAQAQALAVQRFRAKAQSLAQQFGFRDYTLREVQVSDGDEPRPVSPMMPRAMAGIAAMDMAVPLQAGRGSVSVTVSGSVLLQP